MVFHRLPFLHDEDDALGGGDIRSRVAGHGDEEREAPVYQVRMTFGALDAPDPPKWQTILTVGATTIVSPGAVVLVGQDLLATCRFTDDGRKRRLMMSYE